MTLQNCWEFKKCERQIGGSNVNELGVCPAATNKEYNGINGGVNAGRICWAISGTFCNGKPEGTFCKKLISCINCNFFSQVKKEQHLYDYILMKPKQH
jgi:hypothetical protein